MIARELVTKLSFQLDKTNLNNFEKSISGFKTKFALTSAAIGYSFKKIIDYAQDFSNDVLDTSALSKYSKVALDDLKALQNVFSKSDISNNIFNSFFKNLSTQIKEASRGVNNELLQIVRESRGAVRASINGQARDVKVVFDEIRQYIRSFADESERLRIIENIFKVDGRTAEAIDTLFKKTNQEFDQLIEKEKQSIDVLNQSTDAAKQFKTQINQLSTEWDKFAQTIGNVLVPIITGLLKSTNDSIEGFKELKREASEGGVFSAIGFLRDAIDNEVGALSGGGAINNMKRRIEQEDAEFYRAAEAEYRRIENQNSSNITNNFDINIDVPPGTKEENAFYITDEIKRVIEQAKDEMARDIINNHPQFE